MYPLKDILNFHRKKTGQFTGTEPGLAPQLEQEMGQVWELSGRYQQGYEPDTSAALSRFRSRLAEDREATPVRQLSRRRRWLAIAASLALLLAGGWWLLNSDTNSPNTFRTTAGEQLNVTLPDGSVALLNEYSTLRYESNYGEGQRTVHLTGEAYFKVMRAETSPFTVHAPTSTVTVLGTAFNFRAYEYEDFTEVEVEEGKVAFRSDVSGEQMELTALQVGVYQYDGRPIKKTQDVEALNAHAWRTGTLAFKKAPCHEAVAAIARYHQTDIQLILGQSPPEKYKLTASFQDEPLENVLELLAETWTAEVIEKANGAVEVRLK